MEFMVYVHTSPNVTGIIGSMFRIKKYAPENQRTQLLKFREKYSGNE